MESWRFLAVAVWRAVSLLGVLLLVVSALAWNWPTPVRAQDGPTSCTIDGQSFPSGAVKYERYSNASGLTIMNRQAAYWRGGWWVERERERWYAPTSVGGNDNGYVHLYAWCGF